MTGGKRLWVWPLLVVLLWLLVGGPLGSKAGKLAQVQENDNSAFLPRSAASTEALDVLVAFQERETLPATVAFEREGGLTATDRGIVRDYPGEFAGVENVGAGGVGPPVVSEDGEAAQVVVQIGAADGEAIATSVDELRDVVAGPPEGPAAYVGGQAGVLGDFIVAFGAIDGLLLGVALAVVLLILVVVYRTPILLLVVLGSAVLALGVASAAIYGLARADLLTVSGQSQGILCILAVGAATDYSLLIVARFREELRDHESTYDPAGGQGGRDRRVQVGVEASGQAEQPTGLAAGEAAAVGPPGCGVAGADAVAQLTSVGLGHDPRERRGHPTARLGQRVQQPGHVAVAQEGEGQVGQPAQRGVEGGQVPSHGGGRAGVASRRPPGGFVMAITHRLPPSARCPPGIGSVE